MRPDGTRSERGVHHRFGTALCHAAALDAQNFITEYADMEVLRRYIQESAAKVSVSRI